MLFEEEISNSNFQLLIEKTRANSENARTDWRIKQSEEVAQRLLN